jgi:predicted membrane-bound mannosyltransferase
VSGPRLALVLLQIAAGVGLATWLRRELSASSARQPLPPRTVAISVAGSLVIVAALAATAAFGREELGTGLLLLIGAGAVVAAALRSRDR